MKLTQSSNDQFMMISAVRYCLGRSSYAVGICLETLMATWDDIIPNTRNVIVRDVIEALMDNMAGDPRIDAPDWRSFARWAWGRLNGAGRDWVKGAVVHKDKPWPLDEVTETERPIS